MDSIETYKLIYDSTPQCVKIISADGLLLKINKAGLQLVGASNFEQVNKASISDIICKEDFDKYWEAHTKALSGEQVEVEYRINTLNKELRVMRCIMLPGKKFEGVGLGVLSFANDISGELIAKNETLFSTTLLNRVKQAVIVTDLTGKILYINAFTKELYGYEEEELIGSSYGMLTVADPILHKRGWELMNKLVNGESWAGEYLMQNKSGRVFPIHTNSAPLIENGVQTGIINISFDITNSKKAELERENLIDELTQRNKDLKQFGYIASHNMRAPVTNLLGLFSLIDKDKITDIETKEIVEGLERSTNNLNLVLKDLIQILNIKDRSNLDKEYLLFQEHFNEATQNLAALIISSKAKINIDFSKVDGVFYKKDYLVNLFFNLISNSIKFKQPDKDPIIYITSIREDQKTKLIYKDNGLGFDMNMVKERIFGMHQRFHKHPESKGLGLYLIKSQLHAMGGEISLQSAPLEGSTFTITF
ncbi:MAG: PAS domain S-box protein [Bacteroidia bacterium]|nr:PAS domain S-box protein [Bacteroidia bacterium]